MTLGISHWKFAAWNLVLLAAAGVSTFAAGVDPMTFVMMG
jgi:hypothetical protein